MTVEVARREYASWAKALAQNSQDHSSGWPLVAQAECETCAYASLQTDAASLRRDLIAACLFAGPRPVWIWPVWLTGMAFA